jgi:hypothetical protein
MTHKTSWCSRRCCGGVHLPNPPWRPRRRAPKARLQTPGSGPGFRLSTVSAARFGSDRADTSVNRARIRCRAIETRVGKRRIEAPQLRQVKRIVLAAVNAGQELHESPGPAAVRPLDGRPERGPGHRIVLSAMIAILAS